MWARPSATTAPSPSRSTVGEAAIGMGDTALGGRDRKEGIMIAAMVVLVIVQAFLVVRMFIG